MKERRSIRAIGSFTGKNLHVHKIPYEIFLSSRSADKKKSSLADLKNGQSQTLGKDNVQFYVTR